MVAMRVAQMLTALLIPAAALKTGRHDVSFASQTLKARNDVGKWHITPTPPPNPRFAAMAIKRQEGGPTCGYYEYNSEAFDCYTDQACVTKDGYFGCTAGSQPFTACLDAFNSLCSQTAQGLGTLCCNFNTDFPLCVTALKPITDNSLSTTITGFRCGNNRAKGIKLVLETKGQPTTPQTATSAPTSTLSSDSTTTTPTSTTQNVPAKTTTMGPSPVPSSATPVGAIVGGVIGGLAVIGFTMLGIAWIWVRNRRERGSGSSGAPGLMNQPYTYTPMPPAGVPSESRPPQAQSSYDMTSYKGFYRQSIVDSLDHESHYHSAPTVAVFTPTASEGLYQSMTAAHGIVPDDHQLLSVVHSSSPVGVGENAMELPSERYDRYQR
ncbi:hypothetical protein CH63R_08772 [Colletotrichum higginsianum IMI 349063]|uniref:Uncharacterized protein n=3 Tax=Colletotrichum higginsianum TaxID=80884 RepID=A0A1B7Y5C7_COLHI|nr:hypothetical protein CH63R_08772 [Colletotrichum higginsianum IMI 349063]OBR07251.1 hypothetical protein CH63R_08772 [Colletotrichum higginsianum IMI 349063]TIC92377.1 hypothetical protein CH35J_010243 [Colletotrichum higginsianum]